MGIKWPGLENLLTIFHHDLSEYSFGFQFDKQSVVWWEDSGSLVMNLPFVTSSLAASLSCPFKSLPAGVARAGEAIALLLASRMDACIQHLLLWGLP